MLGLPFHINPGGLTDSVFASGISGSLPRNLIVRGAPVLFEDWPSVILIFFSFGIGNFLLLSESGLVPTLKTDCDLSPGYTQDSEVIIM